MCHLDLIQIEKLNLAGLQGVVEAVSIKWHLNTIF